jgi:hypothetical protein
VFNHGERTLTNSSTSQQLVSGSVSDQFGQPAGTVSGTVEKTATTTSRVPYSVDYDSLLLKLAMAQPNGTYTVKPYFAHDNLCYQYFGQCVSNRPPGRHLMDQAAKCIHEGGLKDSTQSAEVR